MQDFISGDWTRTSDLTDMSRLLYQLSYTAKIAGGTIPIGVFYVNIYRMIHTTELKVRTYECDSNRHVNNSVYLQYLEYARTEFLYDIGFDYDTMKAEGYAIFVTNINISYRAPAKWGDKLFIHSRPVKKRATSGVFSQEIVHENGTVVSDAEVSWVFVNSGGRPVKLPEKYNREELQP